MDDYYENNYEEVNEWLSVNAPDWVINCIRIVGLYARLGDNIVKKIKETHPELIKKCSEEALKEMETESGIIL